MPNLTVEDLIARAEIIDVAHAYATGIDRRDWRLYRSIFAEEVDLDFSTWGAEPGRMSADAWTASVRQGLSGFTATQHVLSNHVITLQDDEATCVTYMQALHYLVSEGGSDMQTLGGFYTNRLRRTPAGWKIHGCTLTVTWMVGDRGLFTLARERWDREQAQLELQRVN
jgi:3-phenylpropionate/cinnamic acid dioxygenase small subunit